MWDVYATLRHLLLPPADQLAAADQDHFRLAGLQHLASAPPKRFQATLAR